MARGKVTDAKAIARTAVILEKFSVAYRADIVKFLQEERYAQERPGQTEGLIPLRCTAAFKIASMLADLSPAERDRVLDFFKSQLNPTPTE